MLRKPYLLHSIDKQRGVWQIAFGFYLDRATGFRTFFPDDPELSHGQDEFQALPDTAVSEWDGMPGCSQVSGPLTPEAKDLLTGTLAPANQDRLWSFELLLDDQVLLRVEDFTVGFLFAAADELTQLQALGADTSLLEEVDLTPNLHPDTEPAEFSPEEMDALRQELFRSWAKPDGETEP